MIPWAVAVALVASSAVAVATSVRVRATSCGGTTLCWTGLASNLWTDAGNWSPAAAPATGDTLVFPAGAANQAMNNNTGSAITFADVQFQGGGYSVIGYDITLTGQLTSTGDNNVKVGVSRSGATSLTVAVGSGTLTVKGIVNANNGLNVTGPGRLFLTASANAISSVGLDGATNAQLEGGVGSFGDNTSTVTVHSGAALLLNTFNNSFNHFQNPVVLSGNGPGGTGALRGTGGGNSLVDAAVTLAADAGIAQVGLFGSVGESGGAHVLTALSGGGTQSALYSANTYSGGTVVPVGDALFAFVNGSLGSGPATVMGSLSIGHNTTFSNDLTLGGLLLGDSIGNAPVSTWAGPIHLNTGSQNAGIGAGSVANLSISGRVDGADPLALGDGTIIFSGTMANTQTGPVTVDAGRVQLQDTGGVALSATSITARWGTSITEGIGNQLVATATVTLLGGVGVGMPGQFNGALQLEGNAQTLSGLVLTGGRVMTDSAGGTLTVNTVSTTPSSDPAVIGSPSGVPGTLSCPLTGTAFTVARGSPSQDLQVPATITLPGGITKAGAGVMDISGTGNNYGGTRLDAGTLFVDSSQAAAGPVLAQNGAILGGGGTVGDLTSIGATVSPGHSPGIFTTGVTTFDSATTLLVDLNGTGTTAGIDYDQLVASGSLALNGATLTLNLGSTAPAVGQLFTIVIARALAGTFKGLPDGTTFTAGPTRFKITYLASRVLLAVVAVTPPVVPVPDAGGATVAG